MNTSVPDIKVAIGADSFTWSISSGSLPNGLYLNSKTGKISGISTKAWKFTFTVNTSENGASFEKEFYLTIAKTLYLTTKRDSKTLGSLFSCTNLHGSESHSASVLIHYRPVIIFRPLM